jgi:hypothetical protein
VEALSQHSTAQQRSALSDRSIVLYRRLRYWESVQQMYMPGVGTLAKDPAFMTVIDPATEKPIQAPKNMDAYTKWLLMPSAVGTKIACSDWVRLVEFRLRWAQADTALMEIRKAYLVESKLTFKRKTYGHGVREGNRLLQSIKDSNAVIQANVATYRVARMALSNLAPLLPSIPSELERWETKFKALRDCDLRPLPAFDFKLGDGKKRPEKISWIWFQYTQDTEDQNKEEMTDGKFLVLCTIFTFLSHP